MNKRESIRIELTSEQQHQIKAFSGHEITALELEGQELEQRIAPADLQVIKVVDKASPKLF